MSYITKSEPPKTAQQDQFQKLSTILTDTTIKLLMLFKIVVVVVGVDMWITPHFKAKINVHKYVDNLWISIEKCG